MIPLKIFGKNGEHVVVQSIGSFTPDRHPKADRRTMAPGISLVRMIELAPESTSVCWLYVLRCADEGNSFGTICLGRRLENETESLRERSSVETAVFSVTHSLPIQQGSLPSSPM